MITKASKSTESYEIELQAAIDQFGEQLQQRFGNTLSIGIMVTVNGQIHTYTANPTKTQEPTTTPKPKTLGGAIDQLKDEATPNQGGSRKFLLAGTKEEQREEPKTGRFIQFFHNICMDPDIKPSTQNGYLTTYNKLLVFAPLADFSHIDYAFIKKFEKWLTSEGCAINTVAKHLKAIKKAVAHAIHLGYIHPNDDPFKDYPIQQEKRPKRILTFREVEKLDQLYHQATLSPTEQVVLGAFLFACYTNVALNKICL